MKLKKYFLKCSIFFILSPLLASAQSIHLGGLFPTIDHSGTLTDKLEYSLYYFAAFPLIDFKSPNSLKDPYFHLFYSEQALSYIINSKFSITGSYVYQRENVVYNNYVNENRFYLQAKYKHELNQLNFVHRVRFDGRFIQNRFINEIPFTHRLRYLIGFDTPINEKLYFTIYEELFFNTFKNTSVVYGENWAYAALGKKINARNKLEAGLLYVTWNIGEQKWFNQYYLQLTWINHLNFRKEKE